MREARKRNIDKLLSVSHDVGFEKDGEAWLYSEPRATVIGTAVSVG